MSGDGADLTVGYLLAHVEKVSASHVVVSFHDQGSRAGTLVVGRPTWEAIAQPIEGEELPVAIELVSGIRAGR